jgi:hypothetical protein
MNIKKLFTLAFFFSLLSGCDEISNQVNRYKDNGSVKAVDTCIQRNGSDLVKVEITRAQCAKKISKAINVEVSATGFLPSYSNQRYLFLEINGQNTSDYVLTSLAVYVNFVNSEGVTFASPTVTRDDLWYLPGDPIKVTYRFETDMYSKIVENGDQACTDTITKKCWYWVIPTFKGLTVVSANQ